MDDAKIRKNMEQLSSDLGVEIATKEDSWLMGAINKIIGFFNQTFMTSFVTTIGNKIYFPKSMLDDDTAVWTTLPHEMMHGLQFKKMSLVGAALVYLFPHWLALLSLLSLGAIWGDSWYLLCLVNLVWLAPWPAPGRKKMEMEGYAMSLLVMYEQYRAWGYGTEDMDVPAYMVKQFTGPNYYFMWPSEAKARAELGGWLTKVQDGSIDQELPIAADVRRIIQEGVEEG